MRTAFEVLRIIFLIPFKLIKFILYIIYGIFCAIGVVFKLAFGTASLVFKVVYTMLSVALFIFSLMF